MSNRVNDNLCLGNLVENEIRRRRNTANRWILRARADIGMTQEQVNDVLDTPLNTICALR